MSKLQKSRQDFEKEYKTIKQKSAALDAKITVSIHEENLMFYGIPEGGDAANGEDLDKNVCIGHLDMRGLICLSYDLRSVLNLVQTFDQSWLNYTTTPRGK